MTDSRESAAVAKKLEIEPEAFLAGVRQSGLVASAALETALLDVHHADRARSIARHLVKRELLTRFQAQQLLAGRTTGFYLGQYRVLDVLGRGGMGKVFKAEHMTMSRLVALKVLNSDITRTERARELFRREVRAVAKLVHPNIATAFDANEVNGRAFLVLEYISGPSLSTLVREEGPLAIGQACELIRQAALGLQHAHELGMVHRDIKPSNLLVQPPIGQSTPAGGTLKIVDFGLALLPSAGDDALAPDRTIILGTPDYLSPEQARDLRSVDIRADLYSLGCTFYFLLTGQVPFFGGTAIEKITRHAVEEPLAVDKIRAIVPPGVCAIVKKLMAKDPKDRFQEPRDLAEALEKFAEVTPVVWSGHHRVVKSYADENVIPDDVAHDGGESSSGGLSGTMSLAAIASTLVAADRAAARREQRRRHEWGGTAWFLLALAAGFVAGVTLIVATLLLGEGSSH